MTAPQAAAFNAEAEGWIDGEFEDSMPAWGLDDFDLDADLGIVQSARAAADELHG